MAHRRRFPIPFGDLWTRAWIGPDCASQGEKGKQTDDAKVEERKRRHLEQGRAADGAPLSPPPTPSVPPPQ